MKLNYFNYCGFGVAAMILFSTIVRKLYKGQLGRCFLILIITVFLGTVFDIVAVSLDNYYEGAVTVKFIAHSGYIVFHLFTVLMYAAYIIAITDTVHLINKSHILRKLVMLPFTVFLLLLIINNFSGLLFYFDENSGYHRGKLFLYLYVVALFYISAAANILIKYRDSIPVDRWVALFAVIPFTFIPAILQFFYPAYVIEMFMNALCLLFVSLIVQRPEEFMDVETGVRSEASFVTDIKRGMHNRKPMEVLVVKLIDYQNIQDSFSHDEQSQIMRKLAGMIRGYAHGLGMYDAEVYFLRRGIFCAVYSDIHLAKTEFLIYNITDYIKLPLTLANVDINCNINICNIHCPSDIDDYEKLNSFLNNYHEKYNTSGTVIQAAEIINNKNYSMILNMENIINRAIIHKKLKVYYQPIYCIAEKRFKCAEALIRLIDDEYGFVPPDLFIPVAEKNGTIHKIGKYVLESVCEFIASDEFKELGVDYIDVNLSVAQCMNINLKDEILIILEKYGVESSQVVLEITETAASYEHSIMDENIRSLREAGFEFSLDDFGTGYSNMSRIAELPLKMGKLDKTFTKIENNSKLMLVTKSSIHMMKSMNMDIVIEGIETEEMLERFTELGCGFIQGYYFSKPLPEADYVEFIKKAHTNCKINT